MLKRYLSALIPFVMAMQACDVVAGAMAPQTSDAHAIKVTVTPKVTPKALEFEVRMETHARSLNDDPTKAAQLMADGKRYSPLAWEGAPEGGHHRKGVLLFPSITPPPHALELQLRLAGDPEPRIFRWQSR